jgi:hypothetical protein
VLFEEMPQRPDARPGLAAMGAKNWMSPPTKQVRVRLEETSRDFLECRTGAMQMRGAGFLVVAAVWVYRGSVVEVVEGRMRASAICLERRSYCGSDRSARLKFVIPHVREIARNTTQGVSQMLMQVWRKKSTLGE